MHVHRTNLALNIVATLLAATAYSVLVVWAFLEWPARFSHALVGPVAASGEDEALIEPTRPIDWTETRVAVSIYTIVVGAAFAVVGRSGPMARGAGIALFVAGTIVWAFALTTAELHRAVDREFWLRSLAVPAALAAAGMQIGELLPVRSGDLRKEPHRIWAAVILSAWAVIWVVLFAPGGSAHGVFGDLMPVQFGLMLLIRLYGALGKPALSTTPAWLAAIPATLAWAMGWLANTLEGLFS